VGIATFFTQGRELLRAGDRLLVTEDDARTAFASGQYTRIIADPLMEDLCPETDGPRFTPLPHRAVSGRLYSENRARFFSPTPL
jgi:hypothetical protein